MVNYYEKYTTPTESVNPGKGSQHIFDVPKRFLLLGSTGSGKSNSVLELIDRMAGTFIRVILCVRSADEHLYRLLKKMFKYKLIIYY